MTPSHYKIDIDPGFSDCSNMGLKRRIEPETQAASKILAAAEALFSQHGVAQTSIRQITQLAGVNIASVNYHFGSKDDLIEAVFERLIARVADERQGALGRILAAAEAANEPPSLAEIVSSFVLPYLGDGNEAQGVLMARFILTHRLAPNPGTKRIVEAYLNPLAKAYVAAFHKACPKAKPGEMFWPYLLMVSTIVLTATEDRQSDRLSVLSDGLASFSDRQALRNALVKFIVGGLSNTHDDHFILPA